ncbi:hypothetical protein FQA47_010871 [Oryzias melastigma]|uniref:Uncharacterized protein n=1 Tax=Oryzias melastigma TaxID=30732 RepID=A0A834CSR8_ORYME|nr:hypothetical protein FQA47_010871 [Oryzias melastigma]
MLVQYLWKEADRLETAAVDPAPAVCRARFQAQANIDRCIYGQKGSEDNTFQEMWDLYRQYSKQKDQPDQFTDEDRIQKAHTSVRRWLNTPLTHITSVHMKRFRKYISEWSKKISPSSSSSQPKNTDRPVLSRPAALPKPPVSVPQTSRLPSTSQSPVTPVEPPVSDPPVELEGWEALNGIPSADINWLKEDPERGLFSAIQIYKDISGQLKRRRVMKSDRMWFYPPEPPGFISGALPAPHLFFQSRVFVWRRVGVWSQSTGESGPFSLEDIMSDGPGPGVELYPQVEDKVYHSDSEEQSDVLHAAPAHINVTNPNAAAHRQQAVLLETKEARLYLENKKVFPQPPPELLHQFTVLSKTAAD